MTKMIEVSVLSGEVLVEQEMFGNANKAEEFASDRQDTGFKVRVKEIEFVDAPIDGITFATDVLAVTSIAVEYGSMFDEAQQERLQKLNKIFQAKASEMEKDFSAEDVLENLFKKYGV